MSTDGASVQPAIELQLNGRMALDAYNQVCEAEINLDDMITTIVNDDGYPDPEIWQAVQKGLAAAKPLVAMISAALCAKEGRKWPSGSEPPRASGDTI